MSEITTRSNIRSITEISIDQPPESSSVLLDISNYSTLSAVLQSIKPTLSTGISELLESLNVNQKNNMVNVSIVSPNTLRESFKKNFSSCKLDLMGNQKDPVITRKATILKTLEHMNFKVEDQDAIAEDINEILISDNIQALNVGISVMMNRLEVGHTKAFSSTIANACAIASENVGFKTVDIITVNDRIEVLATNHNGQRLLSEISLNKKTNQVNANTETIGITDGSCHVIIKQFDEELRKMNIKIGEQQNAYTGGKCQMSYSRMIDQMDKTSHKKKDFERLRKLNNKVAIKN